MRARTPPAKPELDQRILLPHQDWSKFEILLALRGERAGVRLSYLDGTVELMSPSRRHEGAATMLGRLLEAYALEAGVELAGFGSWTLRASSQDAGAEPDECYVVGADKDRPDLVIEVVPSSGNLDKLQIYRRLGIPEVWWWEGSMLQVYSLQRGAYVRRSKSKLLPELEVERLSRYAERRDQTRATAEFVAELRAASSGKGRR